MTVSVPVLCQEPRHFWGSLVTITVPGLAYEAERAVMSSDSTAGPRVWEVLEGQRGQGHVSL